MTRWHALFCRRNRRRGLFFVMEPAEDAARCDGAGVGVDVDLRRVRDDVQVALLRREYADVFQERGLDLLEDFFGGFGILDVEIVGLAPEIMRGGLGLRRNGIEIAHADAADTLAFPRAGAGGRRADVEPQERRRHEVDDLPAVDMAGKTADFLECRRR